MSCPFNRFLHRIFILNMYLSVFIQVGYVAFYFWRFLGVLSFSSYSSATSHEVIIQDVNSVTRSCFYPAGQYPNMDSCKSDISSTAKCCIIMVFTHTYVPLFFWPSRHNFEADILHL